MRCPTRSRATEDAEATEPEAEEQAEERSWFRIGPRVKRLTVAAVAAGVLFVGAAGFRRARRCSRTSPTARPSTPSSTSPAPPPAPSPRCGPTRRTTWSRCRTGRPSYLGGDFANEYRKYIDAIVAPNKQAQVTNTTQVMGAAVETLTPSEATAIVYTNSVATSPVTKNIPSLRYLSYRLTMERRDAKWLITKMSTVTSLD